MQIRHPLPRIWMMTDPRGSDPIRLLRQSRTPMGMIIRHYECSRRDRHRLVRRIQRAAGTKHIVIVATAPMSAKAWGADGAHDRSPRRSQGLRSVAVHTAREAARARQIKADLVLISPLFSTQSHPGAKPLRRAKAFQLARHCPGHAIAMGGMNEARFRQLRPSCFYGWAGIDAFAIKTRVRT